MNIENHSVFLITVALKLFCLLGYSCGARLTAEYHVEEHFNT